jgi:hypothetical protein
VSAPPAFLGTGAIGEPCTWEMVQYAQRRAHTEVGTLGRRGRRGAAGRTRCGYACAHIARCGRGPRRAGLGGTPGRHDGVGAYVGDGHAVDAQWVCRDGRAPHRAAAVHHRERAHPATQADARNAATATAAPADRVVGRVGPRALAWAKRRGGRWGRCCRRHASRERLSEGHGRIRVQQVIALPCCHVGCRTRSLCKQAAQQRHPCTRQ